VTLAEQAEVFRRLHEAPPMLVLPNAWDAASARLVAEAGFPAIATSSGAVAASLGHEDVDVMPVDEAFGAVARIAGAVDVPVTADIEAGYGLDALELVERLFDAGAIGCNLEDTDHHGGGELVDPVAQAERLAEVVAAGQQAGVNVVVNARVDVFLHREGPPAELVPEAVDRAQRYLEAGATCVYAIGLFDEEAIGQITQAVDGPVNVYVRRSGPGLARLAELGVARASFGGGLYRMALAALGEELERIRSEAP